MYFTVNISGQKAWANQTIIVSDSILTYIQEMKNTQLYSYGGLTTERLLLKLRNRVFSWRYAKNVIIHVGTNDIGSISSSKYESVMKSVVAEIRKCNEECIIFLSTVLPRRKDFENTSLLVNEFNQMLKNVAEGQQNVRVMYCCKSFYCKYQKPIKCLFTADGLHLSVNGLNRMFHFIANTLAHAW